jgi:hypothetical protein
MTVFSTRYVNELVFFFNQIMFHNLHFMQHMSWLLSNIFRVMLMLNKFMHSCLEKFCFCFKIDAAFCIFFMSMTMCTLLWIFSDQHFNFFLKFKKPFFRNFCILKVDFLSIF